MKFDTFTYDCEVNNHSHVALQYTISTAFNFVSNELSSFNVLCACSNVQISAIKSIAYKYDPKAIVMITNTNEVIGEGFVLPEMTAQ